MQNWVAPDFLKNKMEKILSLIAWLLNIHYICNEIDEEQV